MIDLKVVSRLGLEQDMSAAQYIGDYCPGQGALDMIKTSLSDYKDLEISTRLIDILHCNKIDFYKNALVAMDGYLDLSKNVENLSEKRRYLLRIINILRGLNKGRLEVLPKYFEYLKKEIFLADISIHSYSITRIIEEMGLIIPVSELGIFIPIIETGSNHFLQLLNFGHYRECVCLLAILDTNETLSYKSKYAKSYELEADNLKLIPNISQHRIVDTYRKSIIEYEKLQLNDSKTQNEIKLKLVQAQKEAVKQLQQFGTSQYYIPKTPSIQTPEFTDILEALFWLIDFDIQSEQKIKNELDTEIQNSFALKYFSSEITDSMGNTLEVSENNEKLKYLRARENRSHLAKIYLIPRFEIFCEKFSISEYELCDIVSASTFIQKERLDLFVHGLYFGFKGDFVTAIHLLIPQIEHSIRYLLSKYDQITRKLSRKEQTERSLESNLNSLRGILNDDVVFDLQGLLNESFGDNFRNDFAHGLIESRVLYSPNGFYVWWLALKLSLQLDSFLVSQNLNKK